MAKIHRAGAHSAVKGAKRKRVAKGKKTTHGRKGHKLSAEHKKAMQAGRAKWLKSAEGKLWAKHMSDLRKKGLIGRGAKGKHSARGKGKGMFTSKVKGAHTGKKHAKTGHKIEGRGSRKFAKGRKGGKHHARKHGHKRRARR